MPINWLLNWWEERKARLEAGVLLASKPFRSTLPSGEWWFSFPIGDYVIQATVSDGSVVVRTADRETTRRKGLPEGLAKGRPPQELSEEVVEWVQSLTGRVVVPDPSFEGKAQLLQRFLEAAGMDKLSAWACVVVTDL